MPRLAGRAGVPLNARNWHDTAANKGVQGACRYCHCDRSTPTARAGLPFWQSGKGTRRASPAAKSVRPKNVDPWPGPFYKGLAMTRVPHPALLWTANLLVPGTGLVLLGRLATGVLFGIVWGLALAALVLATLVWPDAFTTDRLITVIVVAVAVYAGSQVVLYLRWRAMGRHLKGDGRDDAFREALVATLQGRLDDAKAVCRALLRTDPDDVEATLHLGTLARRRGRRETALRYFRRARYLDDDGRWDFEIGREIAALTESGRSGAAPAEATSHGGADEPSGS